MRADADLAGRSDDRVVADVDVLAVHRAQAQVRQRVDRIHPQTGVIESGAILNLRATPAPNPRAAAEYYPAGYWFSMLEIPAKSEFPGTGPNGNGISERMRSQADWLNQAYGARSCTLHWRHDKYDAEVMAHSGYFTDAQLIDYAENYTGSDLWSLADSRKSTIGSLWRHSSRGRSSGTPSSFCTAASVNRRGLPLVPPLLRLRFHSGEQRARRRGLLPPRPQNLREQRSETVRDGTSRPAPVPAQPHHFTAPSRCEGASR